MAMVHSAKIFGNDILTIESSLDIEKWQRRRYTRSAENNPFDFQYYEVAIEVDPYTYGIDYDGKAFYTVTDYRSNIKHGIYHYKTLLVPDIYGNGICLLPDGSALVTRYDQASPGCFNGEPGKLIYIPKNLLP